MSIQSIIHSFSQTQNIDIVRSIVIVVILLVSLLSYKRHRNVPYVKYTVYWLAITFCLVALYSYRYEFSDFKNRITHAFLPYKIIDANGSITIERASNGHFMLEASVNNKSVIFLVDTGATISTLNAETASYVGIDTESLQYDSWVETANGTVRLARAKVNIKIGSVDLEGVNIFVSRGSSENLLGMNTLNKFSSMSIERDKLLLRY